MGAQAVNTFHVYILQCSDNSYYVGFTSDLTARIAQHNSGQGAKWTMVRRPANLVYTEQYELEESAIAREKQLKGWTRVKKEALIKGNKALLKLL